MKRVGQIVVLLVPAGLLAAAGFWLAGAFDPAPAGAALFEDKTPGSGLDFTYRNGEEADLFTMVESVGGGVGLFDYDRDGRLDIFVTGGGHFGPNKEILGYPNRLFRNEGDWRFRDVTMETGLPTDGNFYSHGCAVGDFNNDGWPDVLVTGYGRMALYENRQGKFVEVTRAAGLEDQRPLHFSTSAAWADLDGDGDLDLFVCHYLDWSFANDRVCATESAPRDICGPEQVKPLAPALYFNQGNGAFFEAAASAGMLPGRGLGVVVFDADNDGKLDVFVANDNLDEGNFLFLNHGKGTFEQVAHRRGLALNSAGESDSSMGVAAADYNGSGWLSILVTNYQDQDHGLSRNLGKGYFQRVEHMAGITTLGRHYVGWGTGFFDFDLDGAEDLYIVHGHAQRYPAPPNMLRQRPALFRNLYQPAGNPAQVRFENVTSAAGAYFNAVHRGRGSAFGDLDNDGGIDLVISHLNEPVTLLRNQAPNRGHWLGIELIGTPCRDAVGAKVTLEFAGKALTRRILAGGSYLSSDDRRIVFGLGAARTVERMTVRWPSGQTQTWAGNLLATDRYWRIVEGENDVRPPAIAPSMAVTK